MDDRHRRLAGVRAALGLRVVGEPVPVTSHSNDTWLLRTSDAGDAVLRVCHLGDPARLLREAAGALDWLAASVLPQLPPTASDDLDPQVGSP